MNSIRNWEYKRIGDVCTVERGGSPRPIDSFTTNDPDGINWIKIGDTDDSMFITHTAQKIIPEGMKKSRYVQPGDFLLSNSMSFGRPYILKIDGCIHDGWLVLRDNDNTFDKRFLYYYLSAKPTYEKFKRMAVGGVVNNLNSEMVRKVDVPLPKLEEQSSIADLLDKVNLIICARKEELKYLDELIKARFVEMFGDAVDNPMKWPTKELQDLVTDDCTISYGIVQTGDDQEDGVPVFRPVDIVNRVPIKSELKKTTEEISNKYKRTILKGRELLITVRANIADTCIVGSEFAGCNVGRGIVPIRTNEEEMLLEFLKHQIDSKHLNDDIKAMAKGITLIQLNMEDLRTVKLMVPPIKQQKVFMEFANQVDKSKVVVQKALVEAQLLFDSLMQKYFG